MSRLVDGHHNLGGWHELTLDSSVGPLCDFITPFLQSWVYAAGRELARWGVKLDGDGDAQVID